VLDGQVAEEGAVLSELGAVERGGESEDLVVQESSLKADCSDEFGVVLLEGVGG